jgi:hypothetical protein
MTASDGTRDPFIDKFFTRIPREVAASFTPAQLDAVKLAFGARSWGSHAVDIRKSFAVPFIWRRIYIVLLMGAERRDAERLRAEGAMFGTLGNALVTLAFLAIVLTPLALALYALKSAAGVDFFPGDGLHGLRENLARQLDFLLK